jgi:hypothetical protein
MNETAAKYIRAARMSVTIAYVEILQWSFIIGHAARCADSNVQFKVEDRHFGLYYGDYRVVGRNAGYFLLLMAR